MESSTRAGRIIRGSMLSAAAALAGLGAAQQQAIQAAQEFNSAMNPNGEAQNGARERAKLDRLRFLAEYNQVHGRRGQGWVKRPRAFCGNRNAWSVAQDRRRSKKARNVARNKKSHRG